MWRLSVAFLARQQLALHALTAAQLDHYFDHIALTFPTAGNECSSFPAECTQMHAPLCIRIHIALMMAI